MFLIVHSLDYVIKNVANRAFFRLCVILISSEIVVGEFEALKGL